MTISGAQIVAALGFLGVIAGSFMSWAHFGMFSVSGISGDGLFTLVLGGVGLALMPLRSRKAAVLAFLAGVVACAIAAYDAATLARLQSDAEIVGAWLVLRPEIGNGLVVVIAAATLSVFASIARFVELAPRRKLTKAGAIRRYRRVSSA
jgi:hypothetical protein